MTDLAQIRAEMRGWGLRYLALWDRVAALEGSGQRAPSATLPAMPDSTVLPAKAEPRLPRSGRTAAARLGWCDQRIETLERLWRSGAEDAALLAALHDIAGPALSWRQVKDKANRMRLGVRPRKPWRQGPRPVTVLELDTSGVVLPPGVKLTRRFTHERAALLALMWPSLGYSLSSIAATLRAAPGDACTCQDTLLYQWAARLGMGKRGGLAAPTAWPQGATIDADNRITSPAAINRGGYSAPPICVQPPRPAPAPGPVAEAPAALAKPASVQSGPDNRITSPAAINRDGVSLLPPLPAADLPRGAFSLGYGRHAKATTAAPPEPENRPELADAAVQSLHDKARAMLFRGTETDVVAMHTKLPLREVLRLKGEVREARRIAAEEACA